MSVITGGTIDGCDDCVVGTDDFAPLADNDPNEDVDLTDVSAFLNGYTGSP